MNVLLSRSQVDDTVRTRTLLIAFALVAVTLGVFAANASERALLMAALVLLPSIVAITVPPTALTPVLAALVPFQLFFFIEGTNYATRAAVIFLAVAASRLLVERGIHASLRGWTWIAPTGLYLSVAFIAAFDSPERYLAFKGIYEWLAIVACIFITALTVQSARTLNRTISILVIGGAIQAILGLAEYAAGLERVLRALTSPISGLFFQPNLLQERLGDLTFNWILSGRGLPFGTFINGIDYAIFLAAIIMLALVRTTTRSSRTRIGFWLGCVFVMGVALLLTLKGSGFIALVGGAIALAICLTPHFSRRMFHTVLAVVVLGILVTLPFADAISQRTGFLIQREQDQFREVGRLRIWLNLLSSFAERPIFGHGLNSSEFIVESARTLRGGAFALNPTSPESSYVETLIETGAVGFFALMSLFGVTLVRAYRRAREGANAIAYAGVFAALVAILFGNLTVSAFTSDQNGMLMGILIGLVFAEWKTP